jgi:hypothetical protein
MRVVSRDASRLSFSLRVLTNNTIHNSLPSSHVYCWVLISSPVFDHSTQTLEHRRLGNSFHNHAESRLLHLVFRD